VVTTPPAPPTPTFEPPEASVSAASRAASRQLTVRGDHFLPSSTVTAILHSTPVPLGRAQVGADGTFELASPVPARVRVGHHTVEIEGTGADGQPAALRIPMDLTPGHSPRRGNHAGLVAVAAVLLLASVGAILARRTRPPDLEPLG
jgi:hypothetical protein